MWNKPIKNLRWTIAALIFFNTLINYVDRQTLSVLAPTLTKDLHLSEIEYANIVQAFLISYTAMYIPAGIAFDRYSVKAIFAGATLWWSFAEILPVFTRTAWQLGTARFLLGIGEAFTFIGATSVSAIWYPAGERALLSGLANAAAVIGAIVTPPVVVWIFLSWGWKAAFLTTAASGLVWVALWLGWYHPPEKHPNITSDEAVLLKKEDAIADADVLPMETNWWKLLSLRQTWGLLISRIFSDPVWWFYLFWMPKYLTESRGFSMKQMGMVVWIPYLAADIGSIGGGWISGQLIQRGWGVLRARRAVMLASVSMMPLGIITAYTSSSALAIAIVSLVLCCHMSWKTNLMTMTVDVYPRPIVASVAGIVGTGGGIGAALFTSVAGQILQRYSYGPIFWVMGFLHLTAYFFVHWLVPAGPGSGQTAVSLRPAPAGA